MFAIVALLVFDIDECYFIVGFIVQYNWRRLVKEYSVAWVKRKYENTENIKAK